MKFTQTQLKQIIKEELQKVLKEYIEINPKDNSDEVSTLGVMFKPPFRKYIVHEELFEVLVRKLGWYETKESQWNGPEINRLIKDPNSSVFSKNYDYTVGNSSKRFPVVVIITKNSDNNYSVFLLTTKGKEELIKNQNIDDIFNYFQSRFSSQAEQIVDDIYESS
ncbi:hypothetical protein EBU94_08555, partial [bacterium]|nr:hypothetical protein [bacterium]